MREIKNITITPKQDCAHCQGNGVLKGNAVPMPFGIGYTTEPGDFCHCVLEQLPDGDEDTYNIFFKFPEPDAGERFTWTYGPESRNTIFINDNNLPNPKERGIAGINCHQLGNEEAERLAKAFCRASAMLALLEKAFPIIEAEAEMRDEGQQDARVVGTAGYWSEMRELVAEISREIELAHGREPLPDDDPDDDDYDDDDYDYAADDQNFDAARERRIFGK